MSDMPFLPYGKQNINEEDVQAVLEAVRSELISQGPTITAFEERVAQYCGCKYAVAVSSGTAGLHLAALAAGLEPGKRLWTSAMSFAASANCGLYTGAAVDFVDISPTSFNLDIELLAEKLAVAEKSGSLPDVVIPVHFAGLSCPMQSIRELADQYGLKIIEDACHALGGQYLGNKVGSCQFSDMAVFSFHPVKSIATGEGGMVLTNDEELYEKLINLRTHGITKDPNALNENHGSWYYEMQVLGYNYRISDILCALGLSQMKRLDEFVQKKQTWSEVYRRLLSEMPVKIQAHDPDCVSAWHLYVIRLELGQINKNRREVFEEMRANQIGVQVHYLPIPMQPFYKNLGFEMDHYPEAKKYYNEAFSLPLFPELGVEGVDRVVQTLESIL